MSLPSGLIFFMDFVKSDSARGDGTSVYGGNQIASQITGGVDLGSVSNGLDAGGFYDFNTGYAHATASQAADTSIAAVGTVAIGGDTDVDAFNATTAAGHELRKLIDYDADLLAAPGTTKVLIVDVTKPTDLNENALSAVDCGSGEGIVTNLSLRSP